MHSVPQHLLSEDRQDYERILDEALRSNRPELAALGERLNPEQLRTMALNATALIAAAAASEYRHYVKVREELRDPRVSTPSSAHQTGTGASGTGVLRGAATMPQAAQAAEATGGGIGRRVLASILGVEHRTGRSRDTHGSRSLPLRIRLATALLGSRARPAAPRPAPAPPRPPSEPGAAAAFAVTASILFGALGVICLLTGYVLKTLGSAPATADTVIGSGLVLSGIMILVSLAGVIWLIGTALREASLPRGADRDHQLSTEVERARQVWRQALLERGFLPFFQEALAEPGTATWRRHDPPRTPPGRMPRRDYDRPGFSSPYDGPDLGQRPDFGGPERQPE
ncbi:hypothetical protein ACWGLF_44900 [Streptomyces puniciscabiei]